MFELASEPGDDDDVTRRSSSSSSYAGVDDDDEDEDDDEDDANQSDDNNEVMGDDDDDEDNEGACGEHVIEQTTAVTHEVKQVNVPAQNDDVEGVAHAQGEQAEAPETALSVADVETLPPSQYVGVLDPLSAPNAHAR